MVPHLLACCLLLAGAAPRRRSFASAPIPTICRSPIAQGEGFENKIVEVIAQRSGRDGQLYMVGATARLCAQHAEAAISATSGRASRAVSRCWRRRGRTTARPMSSSRAPIGSLNIASFDDPRLRQLRIGVQMIGNDAQNTPPAHALARRGIVDNVRGYMIYGDYRTANPPAAIIDAVAKGDVDVAVVWGPLAGYFAQQRGGLDITPVQPAFDGPQWPMAFDIAMGVRRGEPGFKSEINRELVRNRAAIEAILK